MTPKASIWKKIQRLAAFAAAVLIFGLMAYTFYPRIETYRTHQRRKAELEAEITDREALIKNLQLMQQQLLTDPRFAEKIAHEEGLAHPNEVVYRFMDEPAVERTTAP
jgi:hypothetical protein